MAASLPRSTAAAATAATPDSESGPRLWDPVVRVSHWGIALVVLFNAVLDQGGGTLHVTLGWIGMALLALRFIWGFAGPAEARFTAFPPRPVAALAHLGALRRGALRRYRSHNPAGALMAYALWALLALIMATGLIMTGGRTPMRVAEENAAVAAGDWSVLVKTGKTGEDAGKGLKKAAGEVHEMAADLILILVLLHVAGVAVESRALGRNLLAPMLAGGRRQ
ncbi:MAG: cytochrome b/b6 domain-containing protein [Rhodobacteraceae bacterium]|jgi:cytochrome b|nr:cytochrome b/b6 domain-containing protein [Paracoccaceae bacterium]